MRDCNIDGARFDGVEAASARPHRRPGRTGRSFTAPPFLSRAVLALAGWGGWPTLAAEADVVIYGGTTGGVFSAIAAAREGASVIVLEPGAHVGGMVTSGLGDTDTGIRESIGGLAADFYRRVHDHYAQPEAWKFQRRDGYITAKGFARVAGDGKWWKVEPSVAAALLRRMMEEARVSVHTGQRLAAVIKKERTIVALRCENGTEFRGKVFIDATYEGDLMARAGVAYRIGRESAEPVFMILSQSAGVAAVQAVRTHQPVQGIDAAELQRTLERQGQLIHLSALPTPAQASR